MNNLRLKRAIDKTDERVYNIGMDNGVRMDISSVSFPNIHPSPNKTFNRLTSVNRDRILEQAKSVIDALLGAQDEYKDLYDLEPVASGSFFLSMVHNVRPNDLDIFINTHGMDEEDIQDYVALLRHSMPEHFSFEQSQNAADYMRNIQKVFWDSKKRTYILKDPLQQNSFKAFRVYDIFDTRMFDLKVQLILKDCGPAREDRSEITDDFYCSLVKMHMPLKSPFQLIVSKESMFTFHNKKVIVYGDSQEKTNSKKLNLGVSFWLTVNENLMTTSPRKNKKEGRDFAEEAHKSTMSLAAVRQL